MPHRGGYETTLQLPFDLFGLASQVGKTQVGVVIRFRGLWLESLESPTIVSVVEWAKRISVGVCWSETRDARSEWTWITWDGTE
jgi:hypothetical protein